MAASSLARRMVCPPNLELLAHPGHPRGIALSSGLHVIAMVAIIWLPRLFPTAMVLPMKEVTASEIAGPGPLVMPVLPRLEDRGAGSRESAGRAKAPGSALAEPVAGPEPRQPDFTASQEIVSVAPDAVNRVQTIRRPDLVAPPKLKFPLRLQSMVVLPQSAAPVLTPPETPKQPPVSAPTASVEVPVLKPVTPEPAVVVTPKRASVIPAPSKATPTVAPNLRVAGAPENLPKSVVVINAVAVAPDPGVQVPDAELAGNFVVGTPSNAHTTEKSSATGAGHAAEAPQGPSNHGAASGSDSSSGTGSAASHAPGAGVGDHVEPGAGRGATAGNGSGNTVVAGGKPGAGAGPGPGLTAGPGSGNGSPGAGAGNLPSTGISISGGIPGPNGATVATAVPQHRSYGMMIISGGNNGGASRDVGFFNRNETVYNVSIPVNGGPDWSLQYAVLDGAHASGFLTPPFAQKKVAAIMPKSELVINSGLVFITGVIDEQGKLHTLHPVRPQDPRSQPAIRALEQWEFLPAQMDGKPLASKVLIGVSVTTAQ